MSESEEEPEVAAPPVKDVQSLVPYVDEHRDDIGLCRHGDDPWHHRHCEHTGSDGKRGGSRRRWRDDKGVAAGRSTTW